jgi:hypothetical protein
MSDRALHSRATAKVARAEKVKRILIVVTTVVVLAILGLCLVIVGQVRNTQVDRLPQTEKNDATLALIKDCTEPSGECFKRSQRRTAKAVTQIGAGNILAVVCALDVPDDTPTNVALELVTECVTARLANRHH